jgi:hypothetical protein
LKITYFFYLILSFIFLLFQTVVFANIPILNHFYDLFLIIILYVGLFRPVSEGLSVVLFLGLFIDGISGSPFWVYTTTYIWLLVILKWLIQYFDARSIILPPFAIIVGVLIENSFFIIVSTGFDIDTRFLLNSINILVPQLVWALFTGPFLIVFLKNAHENIRQDVSSREDSGRNKK